VSTFLENMCEMPLRQNIHKLNFKDICDKLTVCLSVPE